MTVLAGQPRLLDKVALITGAGRGIGRATALKLAGEGAKVLVNDLDEGPAGEVVDAIRAMGRDAEAIAGPVDAADFGERAVDAAAQAFGGLDVLINNAGYTIDAMAHNLDDDAFDAMLDVHLKAPFRICRAAGRVWREAFKADPANAPMRKIVNISSTSGTGGNVGQANYAAAKAGVVGLTRTLAKEWAPFRIGVNAVAFGFIDTRLTAPKEDSEPVRVGERPVTLGVPKAMRDVASMMIPVGRPGTAEEAAGAVFLLTIPESDYVTGQTLICGGGFGQLA